MRVRLLIASLVVAAAPGLAMAMCNYGHEKVTMSCPEGQTLDVETNSCITPTG